MLKEKLQITVQEFRGSRASDPRDNVFAFYSLFKDDNGDHIYPVPDYNKTVTQVYVEAASTMARQLGTSLLIFVDGTRDNPHNLPSWVPDFSQDMKQLFMQDSNIYHAALCLESPAPQFSIVDTILKITGCLVDRVIHLQDEPLGAGVLVDGFRALLELLSHIPEVSEIPALPNKEPEEQPEGEREQKSVKITKQSRFEVLWRTKILDSSTFDGMHPAGDWCGDIHKSRLEGFLLLLMLAVYIHDAQGILDELYSEAKENGRDHFIKQFIDDFGEDSAEFMNGLKECANGFDLHKPYIREEVIADIFEVNAVLSMLEGKIPFKSLSRPTPPLWARYEESWKATVAALQTRNYKEFNTRLLSGADILCREVQYFPGGKNMGFRELVGFNDGQLLFATAMGRLGVNPGGLKDGDGIWLVPGLHSPIALRSLGQGRYRALGCVYVHGIMHGEAIPGAGEPITLDLV
jgi:hypothetical protein